MARIVIGGSSAQSREQLSRLLSSSGYPIYRVCANAGELRRALNECEDGLLILAGPMRDCGTDDLFWDYGRTVQMLLIAQQPVLDACEAEGIFRLALPTSRQAVLGAVEMLSQLHRMRLPKRSGAARDAVEAAKQILMEKRRLSEPEAHRLLQQMAMNRGIKMAECAERIVKAEETT